jgi:C4-dicarboxylate-specific signal transduction histidine kinase
MSKVSVRQPLVLYATLFMLLFAAVVVTIASFSLLSGVHRAYRRAVNDELVAVSTRGDVASVLEELRHRSQTSDIDLAVITATSSAFGLSLTGAREVMRRPERDRTLIATRLQTNNTEAYLVAKIDPSIPGSIAKIEAAKMILPVLLGALACAALLALMMRRLLLPSLSALAQIARDPSLRADGLVSDAPNEILEVAQTFRHTLRQLSEERERIRAQHEELERMQASLIRASKLASVGRLAAGIAHEIGNPLAAVQGYLSLIPRLDEAERKEVIERSAKELKRIHETIKKLLAYARQEDTGPAGPIDTRAVVNDAILLVRGHPSLRNVELRRDFEAPPSTSSLPGPADSKLPAPAAENDALGDAGKLGAGDGRDRVAADRDRACVEGRRGRALRHRQRSRHPRRQAGADLRPVLHDEGAR